MDATSQSPEFDAAFSEAVLADIVGGLERAYADAGGNHDPAIGCDALTFGITVYSFGWYRLRQVAEKHPHLNALKVGGADRLHVGPFILCSHRVGGSAEADIRCSFPSNDGATTTMIEQPFLPGLEPNPADISAARHYVLAHLGNPDDGLLAVYACIPAGRHGEKIESWAYTRLLWKRPEAGEERPLAESRIDGAVSLPPETVADFEVQPRRRRKADDDSPTQ